MKNAAFSAGSTHLVARLLAAMVVSLLAVNNLMAGPEDPEDGGQWGSVITWPHIAVSAANLPNGKILTWSGSERESWPSTEQTYTAIWNPANGSFQEIFHSGHNMFCAHQVLLDDGRVFVNGGRNQQNSPWTSIFDPATNQWTQIENMAGGGRWYPTTVALPDGEVFTGLGTATSRRYGELWSDEDQWRLKNGVDFNPMVLNDYTNSGSHGESHWWPLFHVAPNGKIFHSGPTPKMHYIDTSGNGSFTQAGSQFSNWYPKHGATIMYEEGKILTAGGWRSGNNPTSTNRAYTIDLNGPSPQLQEVASMAFSRKFHNAVVLPNGEVLVIGGNTSGQKFSDSGTVYPVEIWNPQSQQWRRGAASSIPRNYHSIALLLTDGRVLSAGGGYLTNGASYNHRDGQVYSPPYLFNSNGSPASRPTIQSAPAAISVGQQFDVQASVNLQKFSLIKMSSTTHAVNTDVRYLDVPFTITSPGHYRLTARDNINVLTPGNWMLFGLNGSGVPSVAKVLRVQTEAENAPPWIATPGNQNTEIGSPVQLQVEAGDPDGDTLDYSATGLPPGLGISASSGLISGAPNAPGVFTVGISAEDPQHLSAETSFDWTVTGGVSEPVIDPPGGVFNSPQDVTITTSTSGASIHYTLDGSTPDETSPTYTGASIPISVDTTLSARAYKTGMSPSAVATADFVFQSVPAAGLVGYWPLDEGSGGVAHDGSGNGHDGTLGDNADWAGEGYVGSNAVAVQRVSDSHVRVPDHASMRFSAADDYSVSFWVRPAPHSVGQAMLWKGGYPKFFGVWLLNDNRVLYSSGSFNSFTSSATVSVGSWHHIVLLQDSGHGSKKRRLYINGVESGSSGSAQPADGAGDLFIGSRGKPSGYEAFDGELDEVRIYDRALSDTEVLALAGQATEPLPPLANAGPDAVVMDADGSGDENITLDGSASSDPDGSIVSYVWTEGANLLASGSSPVANIDVAVGSHQIQLEVTDSQGLSSTDTVNIDVEARVLSSIELAPDTVTLQVSENQQFSATAFDQLGETMAADFQWSAAGGGSVNGDGLFTADASGGPFVLTANAEGITGTAMVTVTVDTAAQATSPALIDEAVSFGVTSNADYLLYNWNFGDGSGDTGFGTYQTIPYAFAEAGRYVVVVTVRDPNTGQEWSHTLHQLVHAQLSDNAPAASASILVQPALGLVWNVNPDNDSVSAISISAETQMAEVSVGDQPVSLAIAPNGNIWVTNKRSASISIIDSGDFSLVDTLLLPHGSQPHGLVFDPLSGYAFVALEGTGEVLKITPIPNYSWETLYAGPGIRHLSVSGDGTTLLVSHFQTPPLPGEATDSPTVEAGGIFYGGQVNVVDPQSFSPMSSVVLRHSDRLPSEHTGPGVPNYLGAAVISPDGLSAWVPSKQDNILAGELRGGEGMTFDQVVRAVSSRIDLVSGSEDFVFRIDHDNAGVASQVTFGPYGAFLFTALESNREVAVSDAYTGVELFRFDVGRAPQGLAFSAADGKLFVHNFMDRSVGIYQVSGIGQELIPEVAELATVTVTGAEALSAQVLIGKQLFYDARDPRLAKDSYMSCASCHNDGGQDGRVWDFTGVGEGLRNTISVEGHGGMAHGMLHWSANFDEVQDFEGQIRDFAGGTGLMNDSDYFAGTRSQPLGDPKVGLSAELDALAAYLASLSQPPDSPHRNIEGTLNEDGLRGLDVFVNKNCASCHAPPRYTDSDDGNLHDVGTLRPSSGSRLGGPLTGIDTPTLLGVWNTAPYLHDGSAFDLTEAVEAHSGISLTNEELDDVVSYLLQLDASTGGAVATPVITPPGGSISGPTSVTLEVETTGAYVYYSLDGSEPDEGSLLYTGQSVTVVGDTTLRARAYKSGLVPSDVAEASFVVETVPLEGLVGYWSLDEGSGGIAHDGSGNGHNGTLGSSADWAGAGLNGGNAISVQRVPDSHVRVPDHASMRFGANEDYTASFWVKAAPHSVGQAMLWKGGYPAFFGVWLLNDNRILFSSGSFKSLASSAAISIGNWHHIVVLQEAAHSSKKRRIYIDGVEAASSGSAQVADGAGDLFIGSRGKPSGYEAFEGDLDEVRIYDRALNDDEILSLSNQGG